MIVFGVALLFSHDLSYERNEDANILLRRLVEFLLSLKDLSDAAIAIGSI